MPISLEKRTFPISGIPGRHPDETVVLRRRFTIGDQEAISTQLLTTGIEFPQDEQLNIGLQTNSRAILCATICQLIVSHTLAGLPQFGEDPDAIHRLDDQQLEYLFDAITSPLLSKHAAPR